MAELLIGVDVEAAVIAELNTRMALTPYPVSAGTKIKDDPEFIRVLAAGGPERDLVTDERTVTIEGWSTQEARAERICAFAIGVLQAAARDGRIGPATGYRVQVFGLPVNLPHPDVPSKYRYTATISVDLRKVVA